jgi:Mg2+-importing ATPase
LPASDVLAQLQTTPSGLSSEEAQRRLGTYGSNAIRTRSVSALRLLARQVRNPMSELLVVVAVVSFFAGERTNAAIILVIVGISVALGFVNEYRAANAIQELHASIRHRVTVMRDGTSTTGDVLMLVPGDIVRLSVGDVVPADLRLLDVTGLECDEAVLTGESLLAEKSVEPSTDTRSPLDLPNAAFMGTIVRSGSATGIVVGTGDRTAFGHIALGLGARPEESAFQRGLRGFSRFLVTVTVALAAAIFVINIVFHRGVLEAALFSLAIAVGLTPELLPVIVTVSLSTGARRLGRESVVVKRLVSIEDLGNVEVLFTDKTGTLTLGAVGFSQALDGGGRPSADVLRYGLLATQREAGGSSAVSQLDDALRSSEAARAVDLAGWRRLAELPFDYDRRLMSVLWSTPKNRRVIVTKGAPESVLARCSDAGGTFAALLDEQFEAGGRLVAVAVRDGGTRTALVPDDERDLSAVGVLVFNDPIKPDVAAALDRLRSLGVELKIVTGDNDRVAGHICREIGLEVRGTLLGSQIDDMDDEALTKALPVTTIFARTTPDQKARLIRRARVSGTDVGFLGDGVNDAVALHEADVGISVDSGADVAKDAADIVLLKKDLNVLATGVMEGRRIFANTIKYILMGTSSNFGNMFSAAGASLFLKFLPMLPTQILLNNLLYDLSQTSIPTDRVDEEQLHRPAHWDTAFIRRFMAFFGPISSVYDYITFGIMLWVFHADAVLFHTAWFVESLATQTLVIFVVRTRRIPFVRSAPSAPLLAAVVGCAGIGAALPFIPPLAHLLGFTPLPASFLAILAGMVVTYLALAEAGKAWFYRLARPPGPTLARRLPAPHRRLLRLAWRWTHVRGALHDRGAISGS